MCKRKMTNHQEGRKEWATLLGRQTVQLYSTSRGKKKEKALSVLLGTYNKQRGQEIVGFM